MKDNVISWYLEMADLSGKVKKNRMSPEQMKNYLEKQAEESEKKPKELIGTWKDYLGMASKLGMT